MLFSVTKSEMQLPLTTRLYMGRLVGDMLISDDEVAGLYVQALFRHGRRHDDLVVTFTEVSQNIVLLSLLHPCKCTNS